MSPEPSPQARRAELRESIATLEAKLKKIERGPAKNTMMAAATATFLGRQRAELAELEEEMSEAGGEAEVGSVPRGETSVLHHLRPDFDIRDSLRPETSVRSHLHPATKTATPHHVLPQMLSTAHDIATDPTTRTRDGAATIRATLNAAEHTYSGHDGWLWADEALAEIERGDNATALWQKVADNLATLTP